jgi:predicted pyridoxine 5'-phosphate oxidase superfamily flavin-nucleotide-binding protein
VITTIEQLEQIYGEWASIGEASTAKVADRITPSYRRLIEVSPFVALATAGPEGLDCSPRGDLPGFVRIHDDNTLMLPDRRGNSRVATLRINGTAQLSVEPDLLASFAVDSKPPRSVIVMTVGEIYFQCARAIVRSELWNPDKRVDTATLPSPGQILAEMSESRVGGAEYDRVWPERARQTLW